MNPDELIRLLRQGDLGYNNEAADMISQLFEQVIALQHIADRDEEILDKYREVVYYICNDYHELSLEKAMVQRDHWKKMCRQAARYEMESKQQ